MRSWPETYAKDVLGTIFDVRDSIIVMEHSIKSRKEQEDDDMFVPECKARYDA